MRAKSGQPIHSSINYSPGDLWATVWHCVPSQPSLGWSPRTRPGSSHSENSTVKGHAKQCHLVHKKKEHHAKLSWEVFLIPFPGQSALAAMEVWTGNRRCQRQNDPGFLQATGGERSPSYSLRGATSTILTVRKKIILSFISLLCSLCVWLQFWAERILQVSLLSLLR